MINFPPEKQRRVRSLRVICVKWGDKYPVDYVYRLCNMCARHLPEHEFVCVTDKPPENPADLAAWPKIQWNPLLCDFEGWWQKIGLFSPGIFPGQNLYLDLDIVITDSLKPLIDAARIEPKKLYAIDDFSYSIQTPRSVSSQMIETLCDMPGTINSSVMSWHGWPDSEVYDVWNEFDPESELIKKTHGDQNWITHALWDLDAIRFFPDGYVRSYKYGNRQAAPIVVFHGEPKPHQVHDQWVKDNWQ